MKGLFVFVLALPAILAAPAAQKAWPTTFPFETQQCTCTDGGVRRTESSCLYLPGDRLDGWVRYYVLYSMPAHLSHTLRNSPICILYGPLQYYSSHINQLFDSSVIL